MPDTQIDATALEAATKRIYEDKGDRKGVLYVGWEAEPEEVKEQWREDVRVSIEAYLAAPCRSCRGADIWLARYRKRAEGW